MEPKQFLNYFLIILGLAISLFAYFFFKDKKNEVFPQKTAISNEEKIKSHEAPSLHQENIKNENLPPSEENVPKSLFYQNRRLVGTHELSLSEIEKLPFINTVDPQWEEKLKEGLTRFKQDNTKNGPHVFPIESLLQVENRERIRYIEIVRIEYDSGKSFMASVDPSKGQIIDTWDHPQF